jgi:hypothetical protein
VSELTITSSAIKESSRTRLPLAVDHEMWLRWLEVRIDPTWRCGEWDVENWFFDSDPEREGSRARAAPSSNAGRS